MIQQTTQRDPSLSSVMEHIKQGWPAVHETELEPFHEKKDKLTIQDGCLMWGSRKKPVQSSISKPASETQDEAQDKETPDPLQSTASATSTYRKASGPCFEQLTRDCCVRLLLAFRKQLALRVCLNFCNQVLLPQHTGRKPRKWEQVTQKKIQRDMSVMKPDVNEFQRNSLTA
ncbi:hypothetical protein P5673_019755 [Acropora cervicornis]|uniref:Uncharacterized protein n=1 Tax=Acropora cervicornis TaxID=6130 RepID=A0AAD9QAL4_ACRCE|nr:hypothetical protein P5673_019755 [Acropora cervicornis]